MLQNHLQYKNSKSYLQVKHIHLSKILLLDKLVKNQLKSINIMIDGKMSVDLKLKTEWFETVATLLSLLNQYLKSDNVF